MLSLLLALSVMIARSCTVYETIFISQSIRTCTNLVRQAIHLQCLPYYFSQMFSGVLAVQLFELDQSLF
jgi:hypothetical protein